MDTYDNYFKNNPTDKIYWLDTGDTKGEFIFSFDKKKNYNLFRDFPDKLTKDELRVFAEENPFWVSFFADRL